MWTTTPVSSSLLSSIMKTFPHWSPLFSPVSRCLCTGPWLDNEITDQGLFYLYRALEHKKMKPTKLTKLDLYSTQSPPLFICRQQHPRYRSEDPDSSLWEQHARIHGALVHWEYALLQTSMNREPHHNERILPLDRLHRQFRKSRLSAHQRIGVLEYGVDVVFMS